MHQKMSHMWDLVKDDIVLDDAAEVFEHKAEKMIPPPTDKCLTREHLYPITERKWKTVLSWAAFHPDQVSSCLDSKGQNALHHACLFKAPADVIGALLFASPESASVSNADGELPIHWAVRVEAPDEVLKLLLEACPNTGVAPDNNGHSALSLLWDRHQKTLRHIVATSAAASKANAGKEGNEADELFVGTKGKGWRRLMLLLRAFQYCTTSSDVPKGFKFRPLHAAVRCACPLSFVEFILTCQPSSIKERDEFGQLPLAIAVSSPFFNSQQQSRDTIQHLLRRYSNAARLADFSGRYPLTLALTHGKTWESGVEDLFHGYPQSVSIRDPSTNMFPFMIAATPRRMDFETKCAEDSADAKDAMKFIIEHVDTIFRLLLADPECVRV